MTRCKLKPLSCTYSAQALTGSTASPPPSNRDSLTHPLNSLWPLRLTPYGVSSHYLVTIKTLQSVSWLPQHKPITSLRAWKPGAYPHKVSCSSTLTKSPSAKGLLHAPGTSACCSSPRTQMRTASPLWAQRSPHPGSLPGKTELGKALQAIVLSPESYLWASLASGRWVEASLWHPGLRSRCPWGSPPRHVGSQTGTQGPYLRSSAQTLPLGHLRTVGLRLGLTDRCSRTKWAGEWRGLG